MESVKGWAAKQSAAAKHTRYPPGPRIRGRLVPLAVEVYGRWGEEARLQAGSGTPEL